jgi:hypothetical protein
MLKLGKAHAALAGDDSSAFGLAGAVSAVEVEKSKAVQAHGFLRMWSMIAAPRGAAFLLFKPDIPAAKPCASVWGLEATDTTEQESSVWERISDQLP